METFPSSREKKKNLWPNRGTRAGWLNIHTSHSSLGEPRTNAPPACHTKSGHWTFRVTAWVLPGERRRRKKSAPKMVHRPRLIKKDATRGRSGGVAEVRSPHVLSRRGSGCPGKIDGSRRSMTLVVRASGVGSARRASSNDPGSEEGRRRVRVPDIKDPSGRWTPRCCPGWTRFGGGEEGKTGRWERARELLGGETKEGGGRELLGEVLKGNWWVPGEKF